MLKEEKEGKEGDQVTVTAPSVRVFSFESEDFGKLEAESRVVRKHLHVAVSNSARC